MKIFLKVLSCLLPIIILTACSENSEDQSNTDKTETISKEDMSAVSNISRTEVIKDILRSYYQDLENESPDISDYYAPIVNKFYGGNNFTRDKIGGSLKNSFQSSS